MAGERDVLSAEERQELRDEPMLVHTFDAHRLVRLLLVAERPGREDEAYAAGRLAGFEEGLAAAPSPEPLPEREALDGIECPMCGGVGRIFDITEAINAAQAEGTLLVPLRREPDRPT